MKFTCPRCQIQMDKRRLNPGIYWACPNCDGRTAAIPLLRRHIPQNVMRDLWADARTSPISENVSCPACKKPMRSLAPNGIDRTDIIDLCTQCQFVWFDTHEYEALPKHQPQPDKDEIQLPQEAREKLAIYQLETDRQRMATLAWSDDRPDETWKWIPGLLGLPVEVDSVAPARTPWATWIFAATITLASLLAFTDIEDAARTFGLIPAHMWRTAGTTIVTSFFIHADFWHLIGNMYFLLICGDNVEDHLGKRRFTTLLLTSTIVGGLAHALLSSGSTIPCIGASGGISGIIAYYALQFPKARIGIPFRLYIYIVRWFWIPASVLFVFWMIIQIVGSINQTAALTGVSFLAHLGGATTGLIFWIITKPRS